MIEEQQIHFLQLAILYKLLQGRVSRADDDFCEVRQSGNGNELGGNCCEFGIQLEAVEAKAGGSFPLASAGFSAKMGIRRKTK